MEALVLPQPLLLRDAAPLLLTLRGALLEAVRMGLREAEGGCEPALIPVPEAGAVAPAAPLLEAATVALRTLLTVP